MRTIIRAGLLAVCALFIGSANAWAQNWGRPATPRSGACFYEGANFSGQYFCSNAGTTNPLINYRLNDRISSIRVFGNTEVTVYQNQDFQGPSRTFAADVVNLTRGGWNDRVSSYRVRSSTGAGGSRWGRPAVPANGACFYENINYEGQYFCSPLGERAEMVPEGTNDRISSVRLFGNARLAVYRDRDFAGPTQWLDRSEQDLRASGWNDAISSYLVESRGAGNRGRGRGLGWGRDDDLGVEPLNGSLQWLGRVDDRVQLVIRGRSIEERTLSGSRLPEGRASFSSGLPTQPVRLTVNRLGGNGDVRVIQQPSRQNGYTAIVEIYDSTRGAQNYRLEMTWR